MCTEAKQHVEPFPKAVNQSTAPGELTHIDLWGKYIVKSINGNQYYLLFVDDAKCYITISFLKEKQHRQLSIILLNFWCKGENQKAYKLTVETNL